MTINNIDSVFLCLFPCFFNAIGGLVKGEFQYLRREDLLLLGACEDVWASAQSHEIQRPVT